MCTSCVCVCVCACVCVQLTLELARQHVGALALAPPPSMLSEHQLSLWKHGARRRGHVCDPALHTPHTPTLTLNYKYMTTLVVNNFFFANMSDIVGLCSNTVYI